MPAQVTIHLLRLGKPERSYQEGFVADDGNCLRTFSIIPEEFSMRMSEKFQRQNWIRANQRLGSVYKYHFYHEFFNIVEYRDTENKVAGYYCDIVTPLKKIGDEYSLTDLILDLWLSPDHRAIELDRDEFESAISSGLISADLATSALSMLNRLKDEIAQGIFPSIYLKA